MSLLFPIAVSFSIASSLIIVGKINCDEGADLKLLSLISSHAFINSCRLAAGNSITQTYMSIPALLLDFPEPSSPEHFAAARRLGQQWPVFWNVGNVFFRPLSMLGLFGYLVATFTTPVHPSGLYVFSALAHLITIVHSAVHMQPLNERLHALADVHYEDGTADVDIAEAEAMAWRWADLNHTRMFMPLLGSAVALYGILRSP